MATIPPGDLGEMKIPRSKSTAGELKGTRMLRKLDDFIVFGHLDLEFRV